EVVLTDRWKNEKGKERFNFNNGINLNVVTGRARFPILKKAKLGTIFRVKLHKKLSSGRYLPLLVHKSDKEDWDILKEITAVVDYVNREKQIIHAITTDFEEVFFPQIEEGLAKGDFISAKVLSKTVNGETRLE